MKITEIRIINPTDKLKKALKKSAKENKRSESKEAMIILERELFKEERE